MPMSVGDNIVFYQWNADHHDQFAGWIRVIPGAAGANKMHVTVEDDREESGFLNINNVDNEDTPDDDTLIGKDYWRRK